jgi:hypothetical protein
VNHKGGAAGCLDSCGSEGTGRLRAAGRGRGSGLEWSIGRRGGGACRMFGRGDAFRLGLEESAFWRSGETDIRILVRVMVTKYDYDPLGGCLMGRRILTWG